MAIRRYDAAGGVVLHNDKLLLLDRPSRNEVRLPKGHVEDGEDVQDAALRETAEEAGYDDLEILADLGSQIVEFDHEGDHFVRTEHYFLMGIRTTRQRQRDANDSAQFAVRWVDKLDASAKLTFVSEQDVVRRALSAAASLGL